MKTIKWLLSIVVLAAIGLASYVKLSNGPWDATPTVTDNKILFQEHIPVSAAQVYSEDQMADMAKLVDFKQLVLDSEKRKAIPHVLSFRKEIGVGEEAPPFELQTTDGKSASLEAMRGKNVVFMFAAMTCPPAHMQTHKLNQLQTKYSSDDVEFLIVYSIERHHGEPGYQDFTLAQNYQQKMAYAQMLDQEVNLTIAVDGMDEKVLELYGKVPNAAYVLDREGTIVFRASWAQTEKIEEVLDSLLEHQRNG
jgi:peroxiredoxin